MWQRAAQAQGSDRGKCLGIKTGLLRRQNLLAIYCPGRSVGLTGGLMAEYRVYRLDGSGQISRAEWIEADDDDTAERKARDLEDSCVTCEIWQRERLVASFRCNEGSD